MTSMLTEKWIGMLSLAMCAPAVAAPFAIDLRTDNGIPLLCQTDRTRCGAAVGQMALQGYPDGIDRGYDQSVVFDKINVYNNDPPVFWWTEPTGLKQTLMDLGGGPGINWEVVADGDPDRLMYTIAYWITQKYYPVPVVTDKGAHWVLITGFESDVAPSALPPSPNQPPQTINMISISIIEPAIEYPNASPPCPYPEIGGDAITVLASDWTSSLPSQHYWSGPVTSIHSRWNQQYVAVIEPPRQVGYARSPKQKESGTIISPQVAIDSVVAWLDTADTSEKSRYKVLRYGEPQNPMLVNAKAYAYFIVPIGPKGGNSSDGAIKINAYTGELQQIAVFSRARKYVPKDVAVNAAINYAKVKIYEVSGDGELIFQPSDQSQSRFYPLWKFWIKGKPYFVSQSLRVYTGLTQLRLGN